MPASCCLPAAGHGIALENKLSATNLAHARREITQEADGHSHGIIHVCVMKHPAFVEHCLVIGAEDIRIASIKCLTDTCKIARSRPCRSAGQKINDQVLRFSRGLQIRS